MGVQLRDFYETLELGAEVVAAGLGVPCPPRGTEARDSGDGGPAESGDAKGSAARSTGERHGESPRLRPGKEADSAPKQRATVVEGLTESQGEVEATSDEKKLSPEECTHAGQHREEDWTPFRTIAAGFTAVDTSTRVAVRRSHSSQNATEGRVQETDNRVDALSLHMSKLQSEIGASNLEAKARAAAFFDRLEATELENEDPIRGEVGPRDEAEAPEGDSLEEELKARMLALSV